MIRSLKGKLVAQIVAGKPGKGFPADLVASAERRLRAIDNAVELDDLRSPPGNRLHALDKDRRGQHAIWINSQWRICFRWVDAGAEDVEIGDYHRG
jgi:proteic killer suppression protein